MTAPDITTPEDTEYVRDPAAPRPLDTDPASYPEQPEWKPGGGDGGQ